MKLHLEEVDHERETLADQNGRCSTALEVITTVAGLIVHYEHRLESQSKALADLAQHCTSLSKKAQEIEDRFTRQCDEYTVTLSLLEKKSLECVMLKIALNRSRQENEGYELHIRTVTRHILEIEQGLQR